MFYKYTASVAVRPQLKPLCYNWDPFTRCESNILSSWKITVVHRNTVADKNISVSSEGKVYTKRLTAHLYGKHFTFNYTHVAFRNVYFFPSVHTSPVLSVSSPCFQVCDWDFSLKFLTSVSSSLCWPDYKWLLCHIPWKRATWLRDVPQPANSDTSKYLFPQICQRYGISSTRALLTWTDRLLLCLKAFPQVL